METRGRHLFDRRNHRLVPATWNSSIRRVGFCEADKTLTDSAVDLYDSASTQTFLWDIFRYPLNLK